MQKTQRRKILKIGGGLCLAGACGLATAMLCLDRWGQSDRAQQADAIVVLGASVREGGVASESLRGRALRAAELYQRKVAPKIITTGGVGDFPPAEAQVAAQIIEAQGVPSGAIVLEAASTSTWENAVNAEALCRERGWKRVVIVSEPYHLWRAVGNFRKQGLVAFASPSPNRPILLRLRMTLREVPLALRDILMRRV